MTDNKSAIEIAQEVVDTAHQTDNVEPTFSFETDKLHITVPYSFVNSDAVSVTPDELEALGEVSLTTTDTPQYKITYDLWMGIKHPSRDAYEAAVAGVEDAQSDSHPQDENNDLTDIEAKYYRFGYDKGVPNTDEDPETVLGGQLPVIIVYHRDQGYSGPKYHGRAFDFNGITEFSPHNSGEMVTDGEITWIETHEMPDVEVEAADGTRYRLSYWIGD